MLCVRDISACVLSVFLTSSSISSAQQDEHKSKSSTIGRIASGVPAAPIYDSQNRPITAGGFVDKGPVIFEDIYGVHKRPRPLSHRIVTQAF